MPKVRFYALGDAPGQCDSAGNSASARPYRAQPSLQAARLAHRLLTAREGQVLVWVEPARSEPPITELSSVERDPRDYTPQHLADKILQSKSAIEGER